MRTRDKVLVKKLCVAAQRQAEHAALEAQTYVMMRHHSEAIMWQAIARMRSASALERLQLILWGEP